MKAGFLILFAASSLTIFSQEKQLTLEEIWKKGTFSAESVWGVNSMNDGLHYTSLESLEKGQAIVKYAYKTGLAIDTIFQSKNSGIDTFDIAGYQFSKDEKQLLLYTDVEAIYRHSTRETYYVYEIASKAFKKLSSGDKQRYATISPDGNKVAFVRNNNITITDLTNNKELEITTDGEWNKVINGATDWVYEEEFAFDKAFFWSPDGSKIAYYRFDESNVKEFSMDKYGTLYPSQYRFKYPKAGEENAKVTIHIYDIKNNTTVNVNLGDEFEYIPRINWTMSSDQLAIRRMNRHQNNLDLLLADANTGKATVILNEKSDTYIDITDDLTFLENGTHFIWSSEKSGYNHLYLYDLNGKELSQITSGNWDVISFEGVDEKNKKVYYLSAEDSPLERHLYSVLTDGSKKTKISSRKGSNSAKFSKEFQFYINYHSDANTPSFITLNDNNGKEIRTLKDNKELQKKLAEYNTSKKEFFTCKAADGTPLNGWMIKPSDYKATQKYPVLMYVYGGPGSQTVKDSWTGSRILWAQLMAQKGYVVVSVDNRGTGARGVAFKKCTYKQLGNIETQDQIAAAKYLTSLPFVDKNRIGIWGWSYGGYMSTLCLAKGADVFKTAIAVAPVGNWRYYDSIYTERYMQTPQENADGYDDNSPISHVDKLKGKYLLIHGTADDNVHFQNSVEMVDALVKANKQFDFFMYPDKNHGIYGGNTRLHLYNKMTNFILENL